MFNHNIVYTLSNKLVLLQCSNLGLEYFLKCFLLEIHCFPRCCTILSKMFCALPAMSPGRRSRGFIKIVAAAAQLEHSVGSSIRGSAMCQHAAMSGIVRGGHTRKCCKDRLPLPHVRPGIKLTPHHLCSQTAAATSQLSYLLPLRWIPPPCPARAERACACACACHAAACGAAAPADRDSPTRGPPTRPRGGWAGSSLVLGRRRRVPGPSLDPPVAPRRRASGLRRHGGAPRRRATVTECMSRLSMGHGVDGGPSIVDGPPFNRAATAGRRSPQQPGPAPVKQTSRVRILTVAAPVSRRLPRRRARHRAWGWAGRAADTRKS